MKKLLIMCGAGHATSTVVRSKITRWLDEENLTDKVIVKQSTISNETSNIENGDYDIVISTTEVPRSIKDQVISGLPLLTGFGADGFYDNLKKLILE